MAVMKSQAFRAGALCRRLAVLRQHLFELLLDADGISGARAPTIPATRADCAPAR
jgi:hypothetical protein